MTNTEAPFQVGDIVRTRTGATRWQVLTVECSQGKFWYVSVAKVGTKNTSSNARANHPAGKFTAV